MRAPATVDHGRRVGAGRMESVVMEAGARTEESSEEVLEFLNHHFLHHEPMNVAIGLVAPGYRTV